MIYELLKKQKFCNIQNEKKLQAEIENVLVGAGVSFEREKIVEQVNIFDFFIDGIVIEVKVRGRKREIYNQLLRYAELECCKSIILLTNVTLGLPATLNNKPISILKLSSAWL